MPARIEIVSLPAGQVNEDRVGASGSLAWVIDGATDVVEAPLTTAQTDASWIAATLDNLLRDAAAEPPADLAALPETLAQRLQLEFQQAARRVPRGRQEHPSAAGLIVRVEGTRLDYLAIGDCSLLVTTSSGVKRIGVADDDAGDLWVADMLRDFHTRHPDAVPEQTRADLWPKLRTARSAMNEPNGYGVLSITPTPPSFIKRGSERVASGGGVLLATDGLMRLVDVFRSYSAEQLVAVAMAQGIAALTEEVRALEDADSGCRRFPRAKCYDDATGLLLKLDAA